MISFYFFKLSSLNILNSTKYILSITVFGSLIENRQSWKNKTLSNIINLKNLPSQEKLEGWICWHRPGRSQVQVYRSVPQDHHQEQCGQTDWRNHGAASSSTWTLHQLNWLPLQWEYCGSADGTPVSPHLVVHMLQMRLLHYMPVECPKRETWCLQWAQMYKNINKLP